MMDKQYNALGLAVLLNLAAIIVCSVGLFTDNWWVDGNGQYYDIFTVVACHENVCVLSDSKTDVWIIVVQVFGLMEIVMLFASLCSQVVIIIRGNRINSMISLSTVGIACMSAMLQIFVVSGKYMAITQAYMATTVVPKNRVLYLSLSVGLCAISGIICIPVAVALLYWRIQNKAA